MTPEEIANKYLSPRAIELGRLDSYVRGSQYDGRPDWFDNTVDVPLIQRKPCIVDPISKTAIGSHVAFVLGEGRWPNITSATSEDDREMDEEWGLSKDDSSTLDKFVNVILLRYASLKSIARAMLTDAMGMRSSAVVICIRRGRLCVETVRASWCTPTLNEFGECTKLVIRYPYIEDFFNDEKQKWDRRCMLYRRELDERDDKVWKPIAALPTGRDPESWPLDKEKTVAHGLGFCPVVWYPFMKLAASSNNVDGIAIHEDQLDEIDCLNISLSQKQRAATMAGDPQAVETGVPEDENPAPVGTASRGLIETRQAYGPGGTPLVDGRGAPLTTSGFATRSSGAGNMARKKGAGVIWRYRDKDSKVSYLTIPGDALKAVEDHAKDVRGKIAESMYAVYMDPSQIRSHTALSSKSLSFFFARQLGYDDQIRDDFGPKGLICLVSMILRVIYSVAGEKKQNKKGIYLPGVEKVLPILKNFEVEQEGSTEAIWMPPRLACDWGPYFDPNEADQLNVVRLVAEAMKAQVITRQMAVEKLATSGVFTVESAKTIVEDIEASIEETDAALHDAMNTMGGGAPGGAGATGAGDASPQLGQAPLTGELHQRGATNSGIGEKVYEQLIEDFPPEAIEWVRAADWQGPVDVPLDSIDLGGLDIAEEPEKKKAGDKAGEPTEETENVDSRPIILINEPNNDKLIVADGHDRIVANKGKTVSAYIATVGAVRGPWDTMPSAKDSGPGGGRAPAAQKNEGGIHAPADSSAPTRKTGGSAGIPDNRRRHYSSRYGW